MAKKTTYITPWQAGARDALVGVYDKWYRYRGGKAAEEYERSWQAHKREDVDYKIIEA